MRSINLFHLLLQKHGSRRDSVFTRYLLRGASEFGRHIKNNTKHEQQLNNNLEIMNTRGATGIIKAGIISHDHAN